MPDLNIPTSDAIIRVRMINTTRVMVVNAESFFEPLKPGQETLNLPIAAFLLDHAPSKRRIMFELGKRLGFVIAALRVNEDTTEILERKGVRLDEISSVIWSHYHWDHTGSMELFPKSTELVVVGPGFEASPRLLPGFPKNPDSPIDAKAIEGRALREIYFDESFADWRVRRVRFLPRRVFLSTRYVRFEFLLFFFVLTLSLTLADDGNVDTPGHCLGHMSGLARTTPGPVSSSSSSSSSNSSNSSTLILLGGDICHFPGVFRPSEALALPQHIPPGILDTDANYFPPICSCSIFTATHPQRDNIPPESSSHKSHPFYRVSTNASAAYIDPAESQRSVDKLVQFDASPNALVCLAHDGTVLRNVPTVNDSPEDDLNGWRQSGYKEKVHWEWLNELPRGGEPGRLKAVEGFWRSGRLWERARKELRGNGEKALSHALWYKAGDIFISRCLTLRHVV
ncbi:hypothetical protein BJX64DRAFT_283950 [Aspergillus heterothallicus]